MPWRREGSSAGPFQDPLRSRPSPETGAEIPHTPGRALPPIDPTATGVRLLIQVQPRASRTELAGRHGDALKVRLAAPPVDGAANEALVRYVAEVLDVPRASIELLSGHSGRRKLVQVTGVSVAQAESALRLGGG